MSGLLSKALKSPVGTSFASLQQLSTSEHEAPLALDDSVHSAQSVCLGSLDQAGSHDDAEDLLFSCEDAEPKGSPFAAEGAGDGTAAMMTLRRSPFAQKPPLPEMSSVGLAIPYTAAQNFLQGAPLARSCPRPILMKSRSQASFQHDADDMDVFVPPHELAASSFIDPTNVAESLSRRGSAALRQRSGVLRRTGFYEGHTETTQTRAPFSSSVLP